MVRDDKSGFKRGNSRRKARSNDQGSDESDEDFIISEEEEHESDEYCSSLDPDESEEALGEFLSEEEEVTIKVKKPTRSKTRKSGLAKRGKGFRKTRKKKSRFSYKQDDDFTDDDDDVEFMPDEIDYVEFEDKTPVKKKKRVSYKEVDDDGENEEDEDDNIKEDDHEFTLDDIIVDEEDEDDDIKDDDHEFTLDEIFIDEEGDMSLQKKNKKVRKPRSRERDIVKGRKRKRNFQVMKKPTSTSKRKRTKRRLVRKTISGIVEISRLAKKPNSDSDEEFANKSLLVEDRGKKIPVQRRRKLVAHSDSDFLCSSASDDEYTIPEEKKVDHRLIGNTSSGIVAFPRLARKQSSGYDGEFANKSLAVEDRGKKKILGRRKKIFLPYSGSDSDSEFLRFESSDDEYTIPEEEKEHHRLVEPTSSVSVPNYRVSRKTSSGSDGANKSLGVEDTSKKIPLRRRKFVAASDSDFICSASSDYEYTISEEEREHANEADEVGYSLKTNLRSSTSMKKTKEEEDMCKKRKRPGRKGKEKLEDMNKVLKQVCGICLSEEGKRTVRGTLNCCSHFFCIACIMEWSKVESRCPLCKQRFVTISKPARSDSGFDLRTVVIQIPERDQVYQPSEEELRGYLDPYEGVICTECLEGGDDALMLLCDVCDSPAHTYCVGLGREVPSGDWYCEGCRPGASSALHSHGLNSVLDQRESNNLSGMASPVHNVGELDLNSLYVPETPLTQQAGPFPIPRRFGSEFHVASPTSGSGAFTVFDRRRIQRQIQNLLSNRRIHSSIQPSGMPSTTSGIRLFGSQIDGGTGLANQRTLTPETRASQYASRDERLQDNTTTMLPNMDASSARSIQLSELGQNPEHVGGGMSYNPFNLRLAYDHLHLCSSRSNIDSDGPSHAFRETVIPSRTSQ